MCRFVSSTEGLCALLVIGLSAVMGCGDDGEQADNKPDTQQQQHDTAPPVDVSTAADASRSQAVDTRGAATDGGAVLVDSGATTKLTTIAIGAVPGGSLAPLQKYFSKYIGVFGVHIVATAKVSDKKVLHAAHVLAQYLDNDEDGVVDNPLVVQTMVKQAGGSVLVMFANGDELDNSGVFESGLEEKFAIQDLQGEETHPEGSRAGNGFDATLEEVLHLVTGKGYSVAYPDVFGEKVGSQIGDAMDKARGGQFISTPASYPSSAWYHYGDDTCDYGCQVTEYFYWSLTSLLGAQGYPGRCAEIANEWQPCTKEKLQNTDPAIYKLLTDPTYKLPSQIPDGSYGV